MMVEWKPFVVLIKRLTYERDEQWRRLNAIWNREVVGSYDLRLGHPAEEEAMKIWKRDLAVTLAAQSSTCQLRTACGCVRMIDLPTKSALRWAYQVPLMDRGPTLEAPISEFARGKIREFRYEGRHNEQGFKILQEQET